MFTLCSISSAILWVVFYDSCCFKLGSNSAISSSHKVWNLPSHSPALPKRLSYRAFKRWQRWNLRCCNLTSSPLFVAKQGNKQCKDMRVAIKYISIFFQLICFSRLSLRLNRRQRNNSHSKFSRQTPQQYHMHLEHKSSTWTLHFTFLSRLWSGKL